MFLYGNAEFSLLLEDAGLTKVEPAISWDVITHTEEKKEKLERNTALY
jgi:hypothetical protein